MIKHMIDCRNNQRDKMPTNSQMFQKIKLVLKYKKTNKFSVSGKADGKTVLYSKQRFSDTYNKC